VSLCEVPQRVENDPRLNPRGFPGGVQLENPVHRLREIQHDGDVAALSGQTRPGAARQDGRVERPARGHSREHVFCITRDDEADRNLTVVGPVRRVQRAASAIEPDLAADGPRELAFELRGALE